MQKMNGILDQILERKRLTDLANKDRVFHFSDFWRCWSRRLIQHNVGKYNVLEIVEINLTPTPKRIGSNWSNDVAPVIFRLHNTPDDSRDRNELHLPEVIEQQMRTNLGFNLAIKLLTEDWLSIIDLDLLRREPIGGTPIHKILRR